MPDRHVIRNLKKIKNKRFKKKCKGEKIKFRTELLIL